MAGNSRWFWFDSDFNFLILGFCPDRLGGRRLLPGVKGGWTDSRRLIDGSGHLQRWMVGLWRARCIGWFIC
jgi:hypothetical protein